MTLFREMTQADHMAAAERAYDRDEARHQAGRDPADDDYFFDDIDTPEDESLGEWVDERIRYYAENLSADELYDPAMREMGEAAA